MQNGARWAVFVQICWLVTVLFQASCKVGSSVVVPLESLSQGTVCRHNDTCILLEFKARLDDTGEPALSSWGSANVSLWRGVTWITDASGELRVQELQLAGLELRGNDIAPLLQGALANLTRLNISNNFFQAQIPDPLGVCPSLSVLDLHNNSLYGVLPQNLSCDGDVVIGSALNLQVLNLSYNELSGEFPLSLFFINSPGHGLLTNVTHINFERNNFSGSIPQSIRNCEALVELNFACNRLSAPIPFDSLGSLRNLQSLDLRNNTFKDRLSIPSNGSGFEQLTSLSLGSNSLRGDVPEGISNLTNLVSLDLTNNSFSGPIPSFLGNLTKLTSLRLAINSFTAIPFDALGNLRNLEVLDVTSNMCVGTIQIPANGGFTELTTFLLSWNNFTGQIPEIIGNFSNLLTLDIQQNNLTGGIPPSLSKLSKLQILRVSFNKLNGTIPSELSQLTSLMTFSVNHNTFTGALPKVSNWRQLRTLWIGQNYFDGIVPVELGSLSNLTVLSIFGNSFNGSIPVQLTRLQQLVVFDVSFNSLSGSIPSELCRLSQLQVLLLNNNGLTGSIPSCIGSFSCMRYLDLSYNMLSGALPEDMSNLSKLAPNVSQAPAELTSASIILDLVYQYSQSPVLWVFSANQLTGPIPSSVGSSEKLQKLLLNNNSLSGPIPKSLGRCSAIFSLDLSQNHLNGTIPTSLTDLTFLSELNLSSNNLSGQIPETFQFSTFPASSFSNNPFLCGLVLNNTDKCNANSTGVSPRSGGRFDEGPFRKLLPLYIILASAVVCICFLGCLVVCNYLGGCPQRCAAPVSDDLDPFDSKEFSGIFHFTVSSALYRFDHRELALGTDNFDESHIIGDGGFGLVYKARLNNGSVVAVKKLTEAGVQGQAEFLAETRTLGKIKKHRNLVSLLGYCAYNSERLLVYEYMENGSLDTWLHCREEDMGSLEWATRLKVARGAAEGLEFLHHGTIPSIIHRDVKASNILLGCDFEAHLADFGLARSAEVYDSHVSTDVAGTAGYIPPEYSQASAATTKGDVYSFGVVLLEILTGRRPMDPFFKSKDMVHVVDWIFDIDWSTEDAVMKTLDVSSTAPPDEMLELMRIACLCCNGVPSKRPTMQQIVLMLNALERHQGSSSSPSVVIYDESMSSPRCR